MRKVEVYNLVDTCDGWRNGTYTDYGMAWVRARQRANGMNHSIDIVNQDGRIVGTVNPDP